MTQDELYSLFAKRIEKDVDLSWAEIVSAINSIDATKRLQLIEKIDSNDVEGVGLFIIRTITDKKHSSALSRINTMGASGKFSIDDLISVLS